MKGQGPAVIVDIPEQMHAAVQVPTENGNGMLRSWNRFHQGSVIIGTVYEKRETVGLSNLPAIATRNEHRGHADLLAGLMPDRLDGRLQCTRNDRSCKKFK